jgi:hypothetical protein
MEKKLTRILVLVCMAVLLTVSSVLTGCGGSSGGNHVVVIGFLGDQTGPSAAAFQSILTSLNDYLTVMEKENPIPGVTLKIATYDTRYEYARIPMGYEYLKEQGMALLLQYMGDQQPITLPNQKEDGVPSYAFAEKKGLENEPLVFCWEPEYYWEGRGTMDYIVSTWDAALGRPLKVGHLAMANYATDQQQNAGMAAVAAENPSKVILTTVQGDPTQTSWASEVNGLRNCDFIVTSSVGPATPTFLNEVRARGFTGKIIGLTQSVLGYWSETKTAVPAKYLDGLLAIHFYLHWTDNSEYISQMKANVAKYFPDRAEQLEQGTVWLTQQVTAQILTDAVRRAAAEVGPANVDGAAIRDALEATAINMPGMGESISCHNGTHVMYRMYRMIKYDAAKDEWFAITDWALPSGLAS